MIWLLLLCVFQLPGPAGKDLAKYETVKYVGTEKVPSWPHPHRITITYDELYPGKRIRGGCTFWDRTKPGSYMPIIEQDEKHVAIEAPHNHKIEWLCEWLVPKPEKP